MHDNDHTEDGSHHGVSTKTVEIVVAAIIFGLGLVVIFDSQRVGAGWADDGPQAGYFPFYVGILLCVCQRLDAATGRVCRQDRCAAFSSAIKNSGW